MARPKRIKTPGLLRHVMSRGNGRMRIFLDDGDYRKFQFVLGDVAELFDLEVWDFCVMPNHYHLAVCPRRPNLSEAIQRLNGVYAIWWNARHKMVGHTFQGRFKDQIVQREGYLWALCRYIARNPVRAKLVDDPAQWRWSSYRATAGLCPNPGFLLNEPILRQFGDDDDAAAGRRIGSTFWRRRPRSTRRKGSARRNASSATDSSSVGSFETRFPTGRTRNPLPSVR